MSDRAVKLLMQRSKRNGERINYDLYSEFGCSLGTDPSVKDDELNSLSVAVLPLPGGEFYHSAQVMRFCRRHLLYRILSTTSAR